MENPYPVAVTARTVTGAINQMFNHTGKPAFGRFFCVGES
jgi:hypothetical protein